MSCTLSRGPDLRRQTPDSRLEEAHDGEECEGCFMIWWQCSHRCEVGVECDACDVMTAGRATGMDVQGEIGLEFALSKIDMLCVVLLVPATPAITHLWRRWPIGGTW